MAIPSYSVANMTATMLERRHPAITRWNRIEGRPRTHNFDRALNAEVRDALWMLSRQWQMGEFHGDDAGSPVLARACVDVVAIDRLQTGAGPVEPLTPDMPLEAIVERRPLRLRNGSQYLSLDLRLAVGRRWLKLLAKSAADPAGVSADYRAAYRGAYAVPVPDPSVKADAEVCAHAETWQQASAAAARAMDGIAFLEHIADPAHSAFDGIGAATADEPKLTALAIVLQEWFASLIVQPPADAGVIRDAWAPERLEYRFGCAATGASGEIVMHGDEYYLGHLDWYALNLDRDEPTLGQPAPAPPPLDRRVHTFVPASIVFEGMPSTRWWAFEDRRTNFGEVRPDTTDLAKLLLAEFGLVYANDWFVLPYTVDVGTIVDVKGIALTNVFGERFWIEPVPVQPASAWAQWAMFGLTSRGAGPDAVMRPLVLLPATPQIQEGEPIEEVAMIRDEMANLVWGVERRVPLPSGWSRPGAEAAREYRALLQRLVGPPPGPPPPPTAPVRYQVMNTVPEHWIPFIPVHVDSSVREIQLQRAALPRLLEGDTGTPEKVRPRTSLLRARLPRAYYVHEEEVPRAGALVSQSYQRTRWVGGKVVTWLGCRKQTGRGEGWSGLRFDQLVPTKKA
jgi:hypothetical protein